MWEERLQKLKAIQEAGGGSQRELSVARAAHAIALSELAGAREKDAEFDAAYAETVAGLRAATATLEFELESAAALLNISNPMNDNWWKDVTAIEVNATNAGVVEHVDVTNGAWVVAKENILNVVQPEKLRFHALGLQSDLGVLRDGLQASIVPPTSSSSGNAIELQNTMHGTLQLGLTGDATDRTIDLYVTPEQLAPWARAGVTAQLEIVTSESGHSELSIPLSAVQQDGLTPIIFRRAPNNPDEVIRIEADLGINDGRWVAILSGVTDGDEVVLDGGFQLMLATSGTIQKGGHFHADGTFHEGDH
jgi:multidrug efflux pump subunit AcrA (membrane-fusion protein)